MAVAVAKSLEEVKSSEFRVKSSELRAFNKNNN